ncbi:MAG: hypothetical protein HZC42_09520 [Candidatus Eisenbacteria bacterium]|nr:hypothetical protein [Candidatus Eisenbacteria bacterium]
MSIPPPFRLLAAGALGGLLALSSAAAARGAPGGAAHRAPSPPRPAAARVAPGTPRPPQDQAHEARLLEDNGAYGQAAATLRALRRRVPPDADLELALALDEARAGDADSARTRLHGPPLAAALVDSLPVTRRHEADWDRDRRWTDGRFEGWHWYVARARAELDAALGRWDEATVAARAAVAARPLAGKEWLVLAVCAGRAGHADEARAAADQAATLDPSLPEALYLSGLWAWKAGQRARAQERFRAAVALDSSYREPALALVRSRLPGVPPDTLPAALLTGVRAAGLLTSAVGPKIEEFAQMDQPAVIVRQELVPIPDSLALTLKPVQIVLPILVDERGRAVLHELPWFSPDQLPAAVVALLAQSLPAWRFTPARRLNEPRRVWASVSIKYGK